MYKGIIRPILFKFDPEKIHHFTTNAFVFLCSLPVVKQLIKSNFTVEDKKLERELFGLKFKNPVGLAAGFDKAASLYNAFSNLGFGFIEVGTITPKGQPGNPKPRMFRLPDDSGLINRLGFNNDGVEAAIANLKKRKVNIVIGGNIGKNKVTPNDQAVNDYETCFEALFPYVDYFVVNVSSPNTPNLRDLQEKEPLKQLLGHLQELNNAKVSRKPLLLKIAPDLTFEQLDDIVEIAQEVKLDGLIATNTTISRAGLKTDAQITTEAGGLSGKPVYDRSNEVIRYLRQKLGSDFPIIGVGGVFTGKDAEEKLKAGANLVQVYTGFIYEGPGMVKRINKHLLSNS
ncbi:MAG: dihydroorotate dehydrogenase (quinone) [Crocinitomicaceae bacterium]|nr:dihydroorotate dehydrogenase (quinone) [Crocinitomicaceae bacterium]|tara:strand:+ start:409 stop:1437 length:1029 start_codon:yes stop_codon:yes gene_type:complete